MQNTSDLPPKKESRSFFTSFVNRVGGTFLAPDDTFNQIITGKVSFWESFLLVLMLIVVECAVVSSFAYRIVSAVTNALNPLTGGMFSSSFMSIVFVSMIFAMIIATLIFWVIVAGIAHLIAKYIFRGQGSYIQLMKLYGYTLVPYSLVILGTVLIGLSWTTWPIAIFFSIVTVFWVVLLMAVAVKHNYGIDIGKGFISSFIGPMLLWLLIMGLFWAWMLLTLRSFTGGLM
jgi:hypothetical protein